MSLDTRLSDLMAAIGPDIKYSRGRTPWGEATPASYGWKAWNFNPHYTGTSGALAAGTGYFSKLWLKNPNILISGAVFLCTAAGATITNAGCAVYSSGGVLLASAINANGMTATAWGSTGYKTVSFTPFTPTGDIYVVQWWTATTLPQVIRFTTAFTGQANYGKTAPNLAIGTIGAGGLTNTAPSPMGTQAQAVTAIPWCAVY